jgi:hypothetical protein
VFVTNQQLDGTKVELFARQMLGILNGSLLTLMTSVGHRTGLIDALAGMPRATSEEIARAANLNERYVREWLGALVVGRIVTYNPTNQTYHLPPEHAVVITRAAGSQNMAVFATFVPQFAKIEDGIVDVFKHGGGVPYSEFPKFQQIMAAVSGQIFDATLLNVTLELVPGLTDRPRAGIDVADIACGSGHAINLMAQAFPASRFTGYDISVGGLTAGRAESSLLATPNARFVEQDVARLDVENAFDLITISTPSTTKPTPARFWAISPARCGRAAHFSPSTGGRRADSRRIWTTRSVRGCMR